MAIELDVDDVDKLDLSLGGPPFDPFDQVLHLLRVPPNDALLPPGLELPWGPGRKGLDFGLARV